MNDYIKLRVDMSPCNETATDIMAAMLAENEYESFEPDSTGLTAYVRAEAFDAAKVAEAVDNFILPDITLTTATELVKGRDWNAEWERNYFKPIVIDGRCVIHSTFHTDTPTCEYDIVINPKMAFGTGHHATTSQVVAQLLHIDLDRQTVIDMGTGTGILAILAAMRGAAHVTAIEIDAFAVENAREHVALNGQSDKIAVIHGDATALEGIEPKADIFIANINRNIIMHDMHLYVEAMKEHATMILSGFYERDIPMIMRVAKPFGFSELTHTTDNEWACLVLRR